MPGLTKQENEILAVKHKSLPFGKMTDLEILQQAVIIPLSINAITGCPLPEGPMQDLFTKHLTQKLKEDYAYLNPDEVDYAFRHNPEIKDYGRPLNLAFIDQVLSAYMDQRREISKFEESAAKPEQKSLPQIEMDDQELLKATFEVYKVVSNYNFIPASVYNHLVTLGEINLSEEEKREIDGMVRAKNPDLTLGFRVEQCKKIAVSRYFNNKIKNQ